MTVGAGIFSFAMVAVPPREPHASIVFAVPFAMPSGCSAEVILIGWIDDQRQPQILIVHDAGFAFS